METYTIKAGDSLTKIAIKIYGNANKWRELADLNNIADPSKIKVGQLLKLMPKNTPTGIPVGPTPSTPAPAPPVTQPVSGEAEITLTGKTVFYRFSNTTDKIELGKLFKLGISRIGNFNTEKFIENNASLLSALNLSSSEINTLLATSQNEGNLDSINTWDNSYLSWGMFQWTMGPLTDAGELPALLKLIKEKQPTAFKTFLGDYGIDIAPSTGNVTGFVTLNNVVQNTDARKKAFRNNNWALRFALAGKDPLICSVQVLHAINRFNRFYFVPDPDFGGLSINDMLSSEYAASLLLDQHVNRPGHVKPVVAAALKQAGISAQQMANGSDADELKVINKYLAIRKTFGKSPMTNSDTRAKVVKNFLDKGLISAKKKSFKSNRALRQ
ncbi:MAG: LysM peptidoglycan-binding domain-containing protein [Ferruginibacter sp.]|nr:LysM peptidoglycan-binding domain-containing protein [Ferruginibacter sp.]